MWTQITAHSLWHLELDTEQTKHALFARCKDFRHQHIFLDDELTRRQQQGRRTLASERLRLKELGHRTWWRRDRLFWADGDGVHSQIPASTRALSSALHAVLEIALITVAVFPCCPSHFTVMNEPTCMCSTCSET